MKYLYVCLLLICIVGSCKKDKKAEPAVPEIELVSIAPTTIEEFKDSVEVVIKYKDKDGDIGDESPDEYSLYLKDSRLAEPDWYHVIPLSPPKTKLKIEGEIKININTFFLLGNGKQELATLTIKLKDRAGNWSNEIIAGPVTVKDTL